MRERIKQEADEAEDDENLDPWGDQFIGVGANRAQQIAHLRPLPKKLVVKPKVLARPKVLTAPVRAIPNIQAAVKAMQPRPVIQQMRPNLQQALRPIAQARPTPSQLRSIRPMKMGKPQAPAGPSINDAYGADESAAWDDESYDGGFSEFSDEDEMVNDQMSDDELMQAQDVADEGEEMSAEAISYGYGYGDFGDEECYPHDGSTYNWNDYGEVDETD